MWECTARGCCSSVSGHQGPSVGVGAGWVWGQWAPDKCAHLLGRLPVEQVGEDCGLSHPQMACHYGGGNWELQLAHWLQQAGRNTACSTDSNLCSWEPPKWERGECCVLNCNRRMRCHGRQGSRKAGANFLHDIALAWFKQQQPGSAGPREACDLVQFILARDFPHVCHQSVKAVAPTLCCSCSPRCPRTSMPPVLLECFSSQHVEAW